MLLKKNKRAFKYIKDQTHELCLEAIKLNPYILEYIKDQTEEICLEAIKQRTGAFEYVKDQTPKICLAAIKKDSYLIEQIKYQTEEICLAAVRQDGNTLQFVKNQTEEICLEAVKNIGEIIKKVKKKTPELCFYAFLNDNTLLEYKYIQKGINEFIKSKNIIENQVFGLKKYSYFNNDSCFLNMNSLKHLKDYLLKQNSNNKYILDDNSDIEILKELAISNNELILVDTGNTKEIYRLLANRIIKEEDLEKESI